jgi:predicted RNA-binding protein
MNPSHWVFSVTPENWEITRKRKIWAVRTENIAKKIKRSDFIVLYVVGGRSFCTIA